ncbi:MULTISPECIES: disulfide oxidoreductase [Bacillus]|uniref:disulfide oxidoreductase n=1 Tax=Bacillus TaxID=1386 RepID=UPI0011A13883|nr:MULTISPECIES: disulfide oxidoreductase [Bacillus]
MINKKNINHLLFLIWVVALIATMGSLFFSEILKYEPCKLCWIQRILMYPIAITGAIAVIRKDYNYIIYVLPLSILGIFISGYHYGIQKGIINIESDHFCGRIPCVGQYINWFGFITIPFLALTAFVIIFLCTLFIYFKKSGEQN